MKFSLRSIIIATFLIFPLFVFAQQPYQPLQPIQRPGGQLYSSDILQYLANIYAFAIALIGALAVVMIVWAGIKYMTSEAFQTKTDAIKQIQAAVFGLLMALGSYVFLYTLNPNLVKFKLKIEPTQLMVGNGSSLMATWSTNTNSRPLTAFVKPGSSSAEAILAAAQYARDNPMDNTQTTETNNGRKACAYAVNEMVEMATGSPAGGGLSVSAMDSALSNNSNFGYVGTDLSQAQPGDIILTQDRGSHVGIVETYGAGSILSNSSNASESSGGQIIVRSTTGSGWTNYFGESKIYRAK